MSVQFWHDSPSCILRATFHPPKCLPQYISRMQPAYGRRQVYSKSFLDSFWFPCDLCPSHFKSSYRVGIRSSRSQQVGVQIQHTQRVSGQPPPPSQTPRRSTGICSTAYIIKRNSHSCPASLTFTDCKNERENSATFWRAEFTLVLGCGESTL